MCESLNYGFDDNMPLCVFDVAEDTMLVSIGYNFSSLVIVIDGQEEIC